jgi:hypothetical protein
MIARYAAMPEYGLPTNEKARVAIASGLSICLVAGIGFEPMTFGL